jgi:hypothetical protein
MRRTILWAAVLLAGITASTAIGLSVLGQAARHEPAFYREALRVRPHVAHDASQQLEKSVLQLQQTSSQPGRWQAVFADEEINGWLAEELPRKLPQLLPPGVVDPRVVVEADTIRCACRYHSRALNFVISFALNVELTDQSNTLAVRVSDVRAGALPVRLQRYLPNIARAAARSGIACRWQETERSDPVALITIPHQHEDYAHREIYVESIELQPGQVRLAGRTERQLSPSDQRVVSLPVFEFATEPNDPTACFRSELGLVTALDLQDST